MEIIYTLAHHPAVIAEDLPHLDSSVRRKIRDVVRTKLLVRPELFGKPLRFMLANHRSLRVGDYRVVYSLEKNVVHIVAIIHRSTEYRGVEKRI